MTQPHDRILIVEDNAADAELISIHLSEAWADVSPERYATFDEARRALDSGPSALVLLDLGLPDTSGIDAVRLTLAHENTLAVIVLTGNSDRAMALEALELGAQDYLDKDSITPSILQRSITFAIARSEHARIASELERTRRLGALGQIVAALAHQLNNPISVIASNNGLAPILIEEALEELDSGNADGTRELLQELSDCIHDNTSGVTRLIAITRSIGAYTGAAPSPIHNVTQRGVLRRAVHLVSSKLPHNIDIDTFVDEDAPMNGAHDFLVSGIAALIQNAVDSMVDSLEHGIVTVSGTVADDRHVITVRDHGHGVDTDLSLRIFEPFFTTRQSHMGIGLTLAREVIRSYGGTLGLANAPDGGTIATVSLPLELEIIKKAELGELFNARRASTLEDDG